MALRCVLTLDVSAVLSLEDYFTMRLYSVMSDPSTPESQTSLPPATENEESFGDLLSQHEKSRAQKAEDAGKGRQGTVVAVTADSVLVDIGFKSEGILPLAIFQE